MYIYPDNFLYFLLLFSISVACGTYLLFTYYVNRLVVANALILFLSALRVALDYYLPSIATYQELKALSSFHGYGAFVVVLICLQWISIWFYVRPFKNFTWEKWANRCFLLFIILPFSTDCYFMYMGKVFSFHHEKIEGYWQFAVNANFWNYHVSRYRVTISVLILSGTLLVGIVRDKKNRIRQFFLFLSYVLAPMLYKKFYVTQGFNIPNSGIIYVLHSLIISSYVSNYRLFKSNINLITKDLFNSISDLTISTNPSFKVVNFNDKAQLFFDIKYNHVQLFFDKYLVDNKTSVQNLVENKQGALEVVLKDKKGRVRTMFLKLAPFKNGQEVYGYTFLLTDLTEIKAKELQLKELNHTKDRLFAIIGHDLRKPALEFRGIQNKVNYLIKKNDYDMLQKLGMSLEKSALSLNNLLDNLLNWASQQQGVVLNSKKQINVAYEVNGLFEFFETVAHNKQIDLIHHISSDTTVYADANAFATIFRNLIDNAIKFTLPNGKITVKEIVEPSRVTLVITDTGIGMDATVLNELFTPQNVKKTKGTAGESGAGLGLTLVKQLIDANNATLSIESKPTQGTKFSVVFKTL